MADTNSKPSKKSKDFADSDEEDYEEEDDDHLRDDMENRAST
jgi:hypothetical protein